MSGRMVNIEDGDPCLLQAIERAHEAAYEKLGRHPAEAGEWERYLPVWARQKLGLDVADDLEGLEATLVPCGC